MTTFAPYTAGPVVVLSTGLYVKRYCCECGCWYLTPPEAPESMCSNCQHDRYRGMSAAEMEVVLRKRERERPKTNHRRGAKRVAELEAEQLEARRKYKREWIAAQRARERGGERVQLTSKAQLESNARSRAKRRQAQSA